MIKRSVTECPEARNEGLLTETVGDELVIFDTETNEAHALKPLAAAVFQAADGRTTIAELAASAGATLGRDVEISEVEVALDELDGVGLLSGSVLSDGVSRRRLLQVGGAAAAGVLVSSALVPAIAAASTTCKPTTPGTLPCGFSEFAVVFKQDGTNNYYFAKISGTNGSTFQCGGTVNGQAGFTMCQGTKITSITVNGTQYPLKSTCIANVTLTLGQSGVAVEIPYGYTLVAWYYHQGQTCKLAQTVGCDKSGCIQINPC